MKQKFSLWSLLVISLFCLSGAAWIEYQSHAKSQFQSELLVSFQTEMIPAYQKKRILVETLMKEAKIHDPAINGILLHIPNWKVSRFDDIDEIEEMNTHLDTWLSNHLPALQSQKPQNPQVARLLSDLQILDQKLNLPRMRLLSQAH